MSILRSNREIQKVAVIDDEPEQLIIMKAQLKLARLDYVKVSGNPYRTVDDLVDQVTNIADAAICDNVLQQRNFAQFYGAESVARFYERKFPSLLITQYLDQDYDLSIRKLRRRIPCVLSKDDLSSDRITQGLQVCWEEISGTLSSERRPCRTLIEIKRIEDESRQAVLDALVPSWNAHQTVRFPKELIPANLHDKVEIGRLFIALVNTGAESAKDLYFDEFELAPEPMTEDEIASLDNP